MIKDGEIIEFVPIKKKKFKSKHVVTYITIFALIMTLGVSYSFFSYANNGTNQMLIVGNIYFNSSDKGNVSLTGLYPMSDKEGIDKGVKYQFDVSGYNLSDQTIYYGIYVNEGDDIPNKTRFRDNDIKLYLTETKDGKTEVVMGPSSIDEFNRNILHAGTIGSNISEEKSITIKYELTMWIDENVLISDSVVDLDGRSIYTSEEFRDSYASVKIEVYGDFIEK